MHKTDILQWKPRNQLLKSLIEMTECFLFSHKVFCFQASLYRGLLPKCDGNTLARHWTWRTFLWHVMFVKDGDESYHITSHQRKISKCLNFAQKGIETIFIMLNRKTKNFLQPHFLSSFKIPTLPMAPWNFTTFNVNNIWFQKKEKRKTQQLRSPPGESHL